MESTTKKWKIEKIKSKKTSMFRSISKQSGESVESVWKTKNKATVGRICGEGRFEPGMKEGRGDEQGSHRIFSRGS